MSKAMKYDDFIAKHGQTAARNLEQQEEFQISSYHSITPQECLNFKVQTDNIYNEKRNKRPSMKQSSSYKKAQKDNYKRLK